MFQVIHSLCLCKPELRQGCWRVILDRGVWKERVDAQNQRSPGTVQEADPLDPLGIVGASGSYVWAASSRQNARLW
jgi:hypothetical protein